MIRTAIGLAVCVVVAAAGARAAENEFLPPADESPVLRLDAGGPLSYVSCLAFSPDGTRLYAAGWDKLVHVWKLSDEGRFVYSREDAVHIPIGAGLDGAINAMALSADGDWLAVAGRGFARSIAGVRDSGWVWPAASLSDKDRWDTGLIYVFHTRTREVRLLRGHQGPVVALAFVDRPDGKPVLVSAADDWSEKELDHTGKLRAWDVENETPLGAADSDPVLDPQQPGGWRWVPFPRPVWSPRLAAWSTGADLKDVRVAVVWGDDHPPERPAKSIVRVWDARTGQIATSEAAVRTRSMLRWPGGAPRFLTGGHREMALWPVHNLPDGRLHRVGPKEDTLRPDDLKLYEVVEAAVLLPGMQRRTADRVAVVIAAHPPVGTEPVYHYSLQMLNIFQAGDQIGLQPLGRRLPLWSGPPRAAALAGSPTGRHLAVAGSMDNAIHLYDSDHLNEPLQKLVAAGATSRDVIFVRHRDDKRLALGFRANAESAVDRVFDIQGRTLSFEPPKQPPGQPPAEPTWNVVQPPGVENWRVDYQRESGRLVFRVTGPGGMSRQVRPEREPGEEPPINEELSAFALCPASEHCPVPLLAAATHVRGEPRLVVYDVEAGHELRWLTGHTERLTSLAFSDDGKLLVSAAEDRTVLVWSLVDLAEKTLGKRGLLRGVTIHSREGRLNVLESAHRALRPQDGIISAVEEARLRTFPTASEFYEFVNRKPPGTRLTLRVERGAAPLDVEVVVQQAIDERKPLFSLFLIPGREPQPWEWIGWHPLGQYDASGPVAESHLGWHFNTGDAQAPARFALSGEYRELNYRRDLLRELIEHHRPLSLPRPEPRVSLFLKTQDGAVLRPDYDNPAHLPATTNRLDAVVEVEDFPGRDVRDITLEINGKPAGTFARVPNDDFTWVADLSELDLKKGLHEIGAVLHTREAVPRRFAQDAPKTLRVQAPAPRIACRLPGHPPAEADAAEFAFEATVTGIAEPVDVTMLHKHQGKLVERWTWENETADLSIKKTLQLRAGNNVVEIRAANRSPLKDFEHREEDLLIRTVEYQRPQLPTITQLGVKRLSPMGDPQVVQPGTQRQVVRVPSGKVQLAGAVKAPDGETLKLVSVGIYEPPTEPGAEPQLRGGFQSAKGFQSNAAGNFVLAEELADALALVPGRHTLVVKAESSKGGVVQAELPIEYVPPLPRIARLHVKPTLRPGKKLPPDVSLPDGVLVDEYHEDEVQVVAELEGPLPAGIDVATALVLNEQPLKDIEVSTDGAGKQLSADVLAPAGQQSKIQVQLAVGDVTRRLSDPVFVQHIRPPRILQVEVPEKTEKPTVEMTARIASVLPLTAVEVSVNGQSLPAELIGAAKRVDGTDEWTVRVESLPLGLGETQGGVNDAGRPADGTRSVPATIVQVWAANVEGKSLAPGEARIEYLPQQPPPVIDVVWRKPREDAMVSNPKIEVEFDVHSDADLRRVTLVVRGERHALEENLKAGSHQFHPPVSLVSGNNELRVEVHTRDGVLRLSNKHLIRLIEGPVRVLVEKVVPLRGNELVNKHSGDGVEFDRPLLAGYGTIHGRVEWPAENDPRKSQVKTVKSWVNGFRHDVAELKPDGSFELDIVLNRNRGNRVEIELPLPRESRQGRSFELDCSQPETEQRLHLLIVGVDAADGQALLDAAYRAFRIQQAAIGRKLTALPTYSEVRMYGRRAEGETLPFSGQVDANEVRRELFEMVDAFRQLKQRPRKLLNEVVVIYYHGKEVRGGDGEFALLTSENWNDPKPPETAITSHLLRRRLNQMPGAHLLLLDVLGDKAPAEKWPTDSHLGLFRIVWSPEAPAIPDDQRLISALRQALAPTGTLKTVHGNIIEQHVSQIRPRVLLFDDQLPQELHELQIGSP